MLRTPSTYQFFRRKNGSNLVLRSRLEAKWAFVFDSLNINWTYEPTVVQLSNTVYIPDFFIPNIGFLEIKPSLNLLIEESSDKLKSAVSILSGKHDHNILTICSNHPTIGQLSPNTTILEWTPEYIKMLGAANFARLLSNASPDLVKRPLDEILSIIEYYIKCSYFIKQEPVPIKYEISKLIVKHSKRSYAEIPDWELAGVLQRKTLTNIVNELAINLNLETEKLFSFSA